ncbi:hypothetical protein BYT27DRAFT_7187567 [Phlegmacium glaucopus]|nr:hypothetical protein BYT27DRAFT_7187567 [Phlegmacium glaucopus]
MSSTRAIFDWRKAQKAEKCEPYGWYQSREYPLANVFPFTEHNVTISSSTRLYERLLDMKKSRVNLQHCRYTKRLVQRQGEELDFLMQTKKLKKTQKWTLRWALDNQCRSLPTPDDKN